MTVEYADKIERSLGRCLSEGNHYVGSIFTPLSAVGKGLSKRDICIALLLCIADLYRRFSLNNATENEWEMFNEYVKTSGACFMRVALSFVEDKELALLSTLPQDSLEYSAESVRIHDHCLKSLPDTETPESFLRLLKGLDDEQSGFSEGPHYWPVVYDRLKLPQKDAPQQFSPTQGKRGHRENGVRQRKWTKLVLIPQHGFARRTRSSRRGMVVESGEEGLHPPRIINGRNLTDTTPLFEVPSVSSVNSVRNPL